MLILTRKLNESVIINRNIEVKIVEIQKNQIKIGFSAPKEIEIYRKEVYEAIQQENIQAVSHGEYEQKMQAIKESLNTNKQKGVNQVGN